jgi:hypothetical protein
MNIKDIKYRSALSIIIFFSLSFSTNAENWIANSVFKEIISSTNQPVSKVQINTDRESCKPSIYFGYVNLAPSLLKVINVNSTNVKFNLIGSNSFGLSFFEAKSNKGKEFVLNEFIKKSSVNFLASPIKGAKADSHKFSASGFTKAMKKKINECRNISEAL